MKSPFLIAVCLVALSILLSSHRQAPEDGAPASSLPGKAAMREREASGSRKAPDSGRAAGRTLETILASGDGASRGELERTVGEWIARHPGKALERLVAIGHPDLDGFVPRAISGLAWEDPAGAARWLAGHPDLAGFDNWAAVMAPWCETDPAAAHTWVRLHLESDMREALRPVMLATCREPGVTAALLDEGVADEVLADLARGVMNREPGHARLLIERIGLKELRDAALSRLGSQDNESTSDERLQELVTEAPGR